MGKPIYKQFRSPQGWYSLLYPAHWESLVVEQIPAFFEPNGSGALQFYAFESKAESYDAVLELTNYLKIHDLDYDEDKVAEFRNNQGSLILASEFYKDSRVWIVYLIANEKKMILVTYNSDEEISDQLFLDLRNIISSIKIIQ